MSDYVLRCESGGITTAVALEHFPFTIGRHKDCDLVLDDQLASRKHCQIDRGGDGLLLRDLQSSNGTFLKGQPVRRAKLNSGDVLRIGKTTLTLVAADATGLGDLDQPEPLDEAALVDEEILPPAAAMPPVDADPLTRLMAMAESLPDRRFNERQIALVNARGQISHGEQAEGDSEAEAVTLLRLILLICFRSRATDIHVEPKNEYQLLRIRVDGAMLEAARLPRETALKLTSLVKVLGNIDIAQRSIVQEGHFSARLEGRRVDYRVSFAPSVQGQKLVVRIFDTSNAPMTATDLKLPEWMRKELMRAIAADAGMVLVCGPTGSGKTTTLYALVRSLDVAQRNVVTIEDPVEIELEGVTQIPVNEAQGNTFPVLLRSLLRQDPDAILVGEIRDPETARTALQAANTGHLVFSTVHTRDTIGTIFRLLDLGVEPFMVAQGLHLVLSQRLVRLLCPACKRPVGLSEDQRTKLERTGLRPKTIYESRGCPRCMGSGFTGRRGVFEMLSATPALREAILKNPTPGEIEKSLAGTPFIHLLDGGLQLVAEGITTFEEIERAVGFN